MNKALKYIFLLFLISYIIAEICCLNYSFYEGYTGFINKYEIVEDPSKAGSIDLIDYQFDRDRMSPEDRIKLLSDKIIDFNELVSIPYKAGSINLKEDYLRQEGILPKEEPVQTDVQEKKEYPKVRYKKIPSKYAPYETILPKQFQTEDVQYVDKREDVKDTFAPQVKKDFKDEKDLKEVKERSELGREIVSENDCQGSWSEWNIDNCGKEDNFCGIKFKTYKIDKVEVSNEKGDGKPCPYKDGLKKYAYCKGNNNVERCGYQENLCNCKLDEDNVLVINKENHYDLLESGKIKDCGEGCEKSKNDIINELSKPTPNYEVIRSSIEDLGKPIGISTTSSKCNISKDINCNCPEGYIFSNTERQNICKLVPDVDCSVKYPGCVYTPPDTNNNIVEKCELPAFLSTAGNQNQKDAFYQQFIKEQGKCIKKECKCDNGTPEDKNCTNHNDDMCKITPCNEGYHMKWDFTKGRNVCKVGGNNFSCPFGTPAPGEGGSRKEIKCEGECAPGYAVQEEIQEYTDSTYNYLEDGWETVNNLCVPENITKCKVPDLLTKNIELKEGVTGCSSSNETTERECGSAFKCKSGYTFMPSGCIGNLGFKDSVSCGPEWDETHKYDTELKMVKCESENANDVEEGLFNGTCIPIICNIGDSLKEAYAIPNVQTECNSTSENCGLTNLRCKEERMMVDQDVNPALLCRAPPNVPFDYNQETERGSLFYSGCDQTRIIGEVIEEHVSQSLLELDLSLNERVVITGLNMINVANFEGYVVGRSNIKGSFPKNKIRIISGRREAEINEELINLSSDELINRARTLEISESKITELGTNTEELKIIIINKILENEAVEAARTRQLEREPTLESTNVEQNQEDADAAAIRNAENTIDPGNISNNLCPVLNIPDNMESLSYDGDQTEVQRNEGITHGTTVTYTCEDGYDFQGVSTTRTCMENGRWSYTDPTCVSSR